MVYFSFPSNPLRWMKPGTCKRQHSWKGTYSWEQCRHSTEGRTSKYFLQKWPFLCLTVKNELEFYLKLFNLWKQANSSPSEGRILTSDQLCAHFSVKYNMKFCQIRALSEFSLSYLASVLARKWYRPTEASLEDGCGTNHKKQGW